MDKPPAVEYCLFWVQSWCLPSSEWATWAQSMGGIFQGFGALAAVVVALWLASRNNADQAKQARQMARAYGNAAVQAFAALRETRHQLSYSYSSDRHLEGLFEEVLLIGRAVPVQQLGTDKGQAVIQLRALVAVAKHRFSDTSWVLDELPAAEGEVIALVRRLQ